LLRNVAAIVSVVTITIIGFRYMMGSVQEKAEYKETMWPVVIGCVLITSISAILTLIQSTF
jgi:type IV secretory pathway VirB2 component (pilin)